MNNIENPYDLDGKISKKYIAIHLKCHGIYLCHSFINLISLMIILLYMGIGLVIFEFKVFNVGFFCFLGLYLIYFFISSIYILVKDFKEKQKLSIINYSFKRGFSFDMESRKSIDDVKTTIYKDEADAVFETGFNVILKKIGFEMNEYLISGVKSELESIDIDTDEMGNYIMRFYKIQIVFYFISLLALCIWSLVNLIVFSSDLSLALYLGYSIIICVLLAFPFTILYYISYLKFIFTSSKYIECYKNENIK